MGRGVIALLTGVLFAGSAMGAVQIKKEKCSEEFKNFHYSILAQDEPAIARAFEKMVLESGSNKVNNCLVEYPTNNGKSIEGLRRVVMDMQWYVIKVVHGIEKREFRHHAMEILYTKRDGPTGGDIREVVGLTVCRTPDLCRQKGLPFPAKTKPNDPVEPVDPTETF